MTAGAAISLLGTVVGGALGVCGGMYPPPVSGVVPPEVGILPPAVGVGDCDCGSFPVDGAPPVPGPLPVAAGGCPPKVTGG